MALRHRARCPTRHCTHPKISLWPQNAARRPPLAQIGLGRVALVSKSVDWYASREAMHYCCQSHLTAGQLNSTNPTEKTYRSASVEIVDLIMLFIDLLANLI